MKKESDFILRKMPDDLKTDFAILCRREHKSMKAKMIEMMTEAVKEQKEREKEGENA